MDWDAVFKAEAKKEALQRKAMGERSTLHSRKRRSDPHRFAKVPDIPVVPVQNQSPNWTNLITETSLPDTPPSPTSPNHPPPPSLHPPATRPPRGDK